MRMTRSKITNQLFHHTYPFIHTYICYVRRAKLYITREIIIKLLTIWSQLRYIKPLYLVNSLIKLIKLSIKKGKRGEGGGRGEWGGEERKEERNV